MNVFNQRVTMAPAFSKEAILQGSVDHLCLVCECYLTSERDVCIHVSTHEHKQNLDNTGYIEEYEKDRIRKIKKWYYCEFCNILVTTITKVRLHIEDLGHKENITSQMMARVDDVVFCGNIAISDEAWHGFSESNGCSICSIEFDDKDVHKSESSHIINLIQSKVINDFNNCYRKNHDSTYHCLTCNIVVAEITAHLHDIKHKNLTQKSIQSKPTLSEEDNKEENHKTNCSSQSKSKIDFIEDENNISGKTDNHAGTNKISEKKSDVKIDEHITKHQKYNGPDGNEQKSDILDFIQEFQKGHIKLNLETHTALCRKCSVNIEFDAKKIHNHIEEHKHRDITPSRKSFENIKNNESANSETLFTNPVFENKNVETKPMETMKQKLDTIQNMSEKHDITYSHNKLFCEKCKKSIPSSVKNIIEHVNGESHKNNVRALINAKKLKDNEKKKINTEHLNKESNINAELSKTPDLKFNESKKANVKKSKLQKVPVQQFVTNLSTVKNMFSEDVIINEKYCINFFAFTFVSMTSPGKFRCLVCEVDVQLENMKNHLEIAQHERVMEEVPVIVNFDSEFIREIRSDRFHCAFCNIVDSWEGMENHLKSTSHKEGKTFASWRLQQYLPLMQHHNIQRQIQNEFMMRYLFS